MDENQPKIKLIRADGCLPTKGKGGTWDLYAYIKNEDGTDNLTIQPNENVMINLGIMSDLPHDCLVFITAREKYVLKKGIAPLIQPKTIDWECGEEWRIILHNYSNQPQTISCGERIACFSIQKTYIPEFDEMIINTEDEEQLIQYVDAPTYTIRYFNNNTSTSSTFDNRSVTQYVYTGGYWSTNTNQI